MGNGFECTTLFFGGCHFESTSLFLGGCGFESTSLFWGSGGCFKYCFLGDYFLLRGILFSLLCGGTLFRTV